MRIICSLLESITVPAMRSVLFMLILVGTSNVASGQAFRLNDEDGWSPLPEPAAGSAEEGLRNARRAIAESWIKRRPFAEIG